jgi:PAS domain S-box-containing protein
MNADPPGGNEYQGAPAESRAIGLAPVGMLVARADGHVIAANQAWTELSGLTGPESMGQGFLDALDPAERAQLREDIRRAALGGGRVFGDYHLEAGSARRTRWWLGQQDGAGGPLVIMAVGDISTGGGSQGEDQPPAGIPIEVADSLILRLNAVAYILASCARIIDHQAATRIGQAITDLDHVIDDLRTSPAPPDPARSAGPDAARPDPARPDED